MYDHTLDRNEWRNLAKDPKYADIKRELAKHLPAIDAPWSEKTYYNGNDYFLQKTVEAGAKGRM